MSIPQFVRRSLSIRIVAAAFILPAFAVTGHQNGSHILAAVTQPSNAYASGGSGCQLNSPGGAIHHVIYIQFDNVHFSRDNPNVPSDLEQMPHLLNFIKSNGTMLTNHHTPLIAHTADDIITSLTGLYGDRHGDPIANTFRYYNPNGTTNPAVSFAYWTDPIYDYSTSKPTDTTYNLITAAPNVNTPAPWVPYTRAGCNFGSISMANTALENISTDIPTVFGANSPQAAEVKADPDQATADFVGIGIHCAAGNGVCSSANGAAADVLPSEPGGYTGYKALFGAKYVAPVINSGKPMNDLDGNVITNADSGKVGFMGFDPTASQSLSYIAHMQEHGVPITYAYIADAHDNRTDGYAYGPGEAGYVAQLKSYDDAFAKFFNRLANDGINATNTQFVVTSDEGDHFIGGQPSNPGCDGVHTACVYSHVTCDGTTTPCPSNNVGEINGNLAGLLATEQGITTRFKVHSDSAPNVYITGNPAPDNESITRPFERATGKLTAKNPLTGNTDHITRYLADPTEMNLLHMITADPARTPTFTMFADPNYYLYAGAPNCKSVCVDQEPGYAWNHGDVSPDVNTTWLGVVGPGVRNLGTTNEVWTDHTDIRPTMLELLGLKDDYTHQGRTIREIIDSSALPSSLKAHGSTLDRLGRAYKQINAPVGELGLDSLDIATRALESGSASDDSTYLRLEQQLQNFTDQRNGLAGQMETMLEGAEFGGQPINEAHAKALIGQARELLGDVEEAEQS